MKVNVVDAVGTLVVSTKGLEAEEGELKKLRVTAALDFITDPQFLDAFLDNVNAGLLPSNTYWRADNADDPASPRYVRQPGAGEITLGVPSSDRLFAVKLRSQAPDEWAGEAEGFPGQIISTLHGCAIKKICVDPLTNGLRVKLKLQADNVQPELAEDLVRLTLVDELKLDLWLVNRDLEAKTPDAPPREPAAAKEGTLLGEVKSAVAAKNKKAEKGLSGSSVVDLFAAKEKKLTGKDAAGDQGAGGLPE